MPEVRGLARKTGQPASLELSLLGVGLLACLGVAVRNPALGLDQFFYPKELALTFFASAAAVVCATRARALSLTRTDALFIGFLAWSAISALGAVNSWWALRALGLTGAGAAVFWVSRSVRDKGGGRALIAFIALGVASIAAVAVLQAYGLLLHVSPGNRAPGGTLGNRNAMAHLVTLGAPAFVLAALAARGRSRVLAGALALAAMSAAVVLSRSRAAWLATMVLAAVTALGVAVSRPEMRARIPRRRVTLLTGAALAGVIGSLCLPNKLKWTSATPYLDSLRGIANYESGSGRGRLLQDGNTLAMVRDRPLVGVGPGNWTVRYPEYALPDDPTYSPIDVVPVRRFPNGDWLGLAAERGLPAVGLLLFAAVLFAVGAWRTVRHDAEPAAVARALALLATLAGLGVLGVTDPVLLTPAGAFLGFMILGTFAPPERRYPLPRLTPLGRRLCVASMLAAAIACTGQSGRQIWAALLYRSDAGPAQLAAATRVNPGDYLAHVLLAQRWVDVARCDLAAPHIETASALYPAAPAPVRLGNACSLTEPPPRGWSSGLEMLNTKVVFSPRCRRVAYSSNRDGRIAPFLLDPAAPTPRTSPVDVFSDRDLFVRSLSADCRFLALVADRYGDGIFKTYLYDFVRGRLTAVTPAEAANEGDPEFSPRDSLLGYLSDGQLRLHDVAAGTDVPVPASPAEFTSIDWSPDGTRIYLEDGATSIWEYAVPERAFRRAWAAPAPTYSPRMIQSYDHFLYFVSDHETAVSQIYELDLRSSRLTRVVPSAHPQYSPRRRSARELVFRTNVDGNVVAMRLRDGRLEQFSPARGVVYDLSLDFDRPLFVYAGERQITSIYAADPDTTAMTDVLAHRFDVAQPSPQEFRTPEGMAQLVFAPDSRPRGWVVWLHGGPHEQVSPRFNPYFDFLTRLGYGVVALNYPGSTGLGKAYELRGIPDSAEIATQLAGIDTALAHVAALYPDFDRYALVGVSYGSALAFLHACTHPGAVTQLVDFSGAATHGTRAALSAGCAQLPPVLAIQGVNDPAQRTPDRRAFAWLRDRLASTTHVMLDREGHYIGRMGSMRIILGEMERFLTGPAS